MLITLWIRRLQETKRRPLVETPAESRQLTTQRHSKSNNRLDLLNHRRTVRLGTAEL